MIEGNRGLDRSSMVVQAGLYLIAGIAFYTLDPTRIADSTRVFISCVLFVLALMISIAVFLPGRRYESLVLSASGLFSPMLIMIAVAVVLVKFVGTDWFMLVVCGLLLLLTIANMIYIICAEVRIQQKIFGTNSAWFGYAIGALIVLPVAGLVAGLMMPFGWIHWICFSLFFVAIGVFIALYNKQSKPVNSEDKSRNG